MKVDEWTSTDVHTPGGGEFPPCAGLTSNALPEAQSTFSAESLQTGVSTRNAHIATDGTASEERKLACVLPSRDGRRSIAPTKPKTQKDEDVPHWYALRTTYGREKKAYDYMTAKGVTAFYPTTEVVKLIKSTLKNSTHAHTFDSALSQRRF